MGTLVRLDENSAIGVGVYIPLLSGMSLHDTVYGATSTVWVDAKTAVAIAYPTICYAKRMNDKLSIGIGASVIKNRPPFVPGPALDSATRPGRSKNLVELTSSRVV